jgi:hypothetical protein
MRRILLSCVLALCHWCCGIAAAADWGFDATAGAGYDDNLSNSFASADRKGAADLSLDLDASLYQQLGSATGLSVAAIAEAAAFDRYSGLNHLGLGGRLQLRHKFGLGAQVPWIAVAARAVHDDYNYSYQSGWELDGSVTVGKQLGERWTLEGSARYDDFSADRLQPQVLPGVSTAAYDTGGWNLVGRVSFLATPADVLVVAYAWRNGTVTSVTAPDEEILEYSDAVALDPVFGDPPRVAYRLRAKTDTFSVVWSHAFGPRTSLNVTYRYRVSVSDEELGEYYSNFVGVNIGYRY